MVDSFINHGLEQYMWKQSEPHSLTVLISFMFICKNTDVWTSEFQLLPMLMPAPFPWAPAAGSLLL